MEIMEIKEEVKVKKRTYIGFTFKRFWTWLINLILPKISVYHRKGTHIICGYPGSGKTLLANKIINSVDSEKYFFISNLNEFKQENVYHYDIWKLFENNKQVKRLPTKDEKCRKLYGLILDEINLKYNRRLNRSKEYNESFIGLIELLVSSRHQGINRVYFIGQKLELQDAQLQSLFKYYHNIIYNKQKSWWPIYKENGTITYAPKKLILDNYIKSYDDEYENLGVEEIKIKYNDLITYNTFGLAEKYKDLQYLVKEQDNYTK